MKTKTINLYTIDELPDDVKNRAVIALSHINVGYNWWECGYDHFFHLAALVGFDVDLKKTYFVGFHHHGQGAGFAAKIDVVKMIRGIQEQRWKADYPDLDFYIEEYLSVMLRVASLIEKGFLEFNSHVKPASSNTIYIVHDTRLFSDGRCKNLVQVEKAIALTEQLVIEMAEALNRYLFRSLRDEFDFLTSRETIMDTIRANDYYFTEKGKLDGD